MVDQDACGVKGEECGQSASRPVYCARYATHKC